MRGCLLHPVRVIFSLTLLYSSSAIVAQEPEHRTTDTDQPEKTTLASGVDRISGLEAASKIHYVRLILSGSPITPSTAESPASSPGPTLIAQCTLKPNGKSSFELFANFGGAADLAFYPPWTPTSSHDLFPPHTEKVNMTMEFLGYTNVKPVRRQWEIPVQTPGQYRYNPPGGGSANLEEITFYLRYLVALPTLRLTLDNRSVEFMTTPLLAEIRKEPLCRGAGL
ncbi:MAG TPA: hypothetical protein VK684_13315 [Edaphobacter sp.]|nr:hypothetical protein [Edaphobacter sp.]